MFESIGDGLLGALVSNSELTKPAIQRLGKALGLTVDLLGANYLQYRSDRQKILHAQRLKQYAEKISVIPAEKVNEIPPEIGVPVMQKLSYITDDELADLFLELLNSASSSDTIQYAQPRFMQIVEALSVDEARVIKYMKNRKTIPYFYYRADSSKATSYDLSYQNTGIEAEINLIFPDNMPTYFDNFMGLSLIKDEKPKGLIGKDELFDKIYGYYNHYEQLQIFQSKYPTSVIKTLNTYFTITSLGQTFIKCCTSKV